MTLDTINILFNFLDRCFKTGNARKGKLWLVTLFINNALEKNQPIGYIISCSSDQNKSVWILVEASGINIRRYEMSRSKSSINATILRLIRGMAFFFQKSSLFKMVFKHYFRGRMSSFAELCCIKDCRVYPVTIKSKVKSIISLFFNSFVVSIWNIKPNLLLTQWKYSGQGMNRQINGAIIKKSVLVFNARPFQ
jgi:hypothetical protein